MKRIHLWEPGTGQQSITVIRSAAVALAEYAVDGARGRAVGDPVHEDVTEKRRAQYEAAFRRGAAWAVKLSKTGGYSSCGDLPPWMLTYLGCRDESVINRTDDGGVKAWVVAVNLSVLHRSPWWVPEGQGDPEPGDPMLTGNESSGKDWHAAVLLRKVSDEQWVEASYGQPYGARRVATVKKTAQYRIVRGKRLRGWVSLARVPLVEPAVVPDDFVGGVEDDSPYRAWWPGG